MINPSVTVREYPIGKLVPSSKYYMEKTYFHKGKRNISIKKLNGVERHQPSGFLKEALIIN